jgi:hypothetical protein
MEFFYWCGQQGDCEPDLKVIGRVCSGCEIAMNAEFNDVMRDIEASGRLEEKGWSK